MKGPQEGTTVCYNHGVVLERWPGAASVGAVASVGVLVFSDVIYHHLGTLLALNCLDPALHPGVNPVGGRILAPYPAAN